MTIIPYCKMKFLNLQNQFKKSLRFFLPILLFQKYKDFKVRASQWVLPNGKANPKGGVFGINQAIRLNLSIQGLSSKDNKYYLRVDADLVNAKNESVMNKAGAINQKLDVDPEQPAVINSHISFRHTTPGLYNLKLTIYDMYAKKKPLEYEQSIHIK